MTQTLTVDIPKTEWMTDNSRLVWAAKARRVAALRHRSKWLARAQGLHPEQCPVRIVATIVTRTRTVFDPNNAAAATKPIIDGLVDAGVLPADDSTHVVGPDHRRGTADPAMRAGWHRIILTIDPTNGRTNQ